MVPFRVRISSLAAGLILSSAALGSADPGALPELTRRLGDPSFAERERAAEAILRLGRTAVPALEEAAKAPDAEIRRRAAELLPLARRSDVDVRFDAFVEGVGDAKPPLPGWNRFRQLAGDDRPARLFFVTLGRADPSLLQLLEDEPARLAQQLAERSRRVGVRRRLRSKSDSTSEFGEAAGLLVAAACSTDKNTAAAHQFFSCLYQPTMRDVVRGNPAARRLLTPFLSRQLGEPWRLQQAAWLARSLGLDEFIEHTLKLETRRQAEAAAAKSDEPGGLAQIAGIAVMLGQQDLIETTLKPAARRIAEKTATKADDPARLSLTLNLLQSLNMQESIDAILRPAACMTIVSVAEKPYDQYRFHMALGLARSLQLKDQADQVLKPAAVKALINLCRQLPTNPGQMYAALDLVQTFELSEAREDFLKPAARRLATSSAASGDLAKLTQAASLANSLGLADVTTETLRPALRKLAAEPTDDANRLTQLVALARDMGMEETVQKVLKPQVRHAMSVAEGRPVGQGVQQVLQLARSLQMKEGVPVALKAARAKDLNAWSRSAAILFVAEFGSAENIPELEKLLTDTDSIGTIGLNFVTIRTEVRDVALASVISLGGQPLDAYDFPYLKLFGGVAGPLSAHSAHCFGFTDSTGRDAALKRWKDRATAKK